MIYKLLLTIGIFVGILIGCLRLLGRITKFLERINKRIEEEGKSNKLTWLMESLTISPGSQQAKLIKVLSMLIMGILGFIITGKLFWGLIFLLLGYFLPTLLVNFLQQQRLKKFDNQLIDALTLISNSLRAGLSLPQALEVLVNETPPPISEEFTTTLEETRLGVPTTEALQNLTQRLASKELRLAVTAINIAQEAGGNMAEVLDRIATTMRERNKIQDKLKTLTIEGKLSGLIVGALPFFLGGVIYLLDPDLMRPMFNTLPGYLMLTAIMILVGLGGFLIKKIVTIDI